MLPTGLTVPASFAFILGHLTDVLLHHAPAGVEGRGGTEPIHQMRVAVRRARSAIRLFHPAIACPAVQAAEASLKALGEQLGPTRDWDVFATETLPTVASVMTNDPRLDRLAAAAERRRGACHVALNAWLTSDAFPVLGIELACLAGADRWQPPPGPAAEPEAAPPPSARGFAVAQLQRRWKKVQADGKNIETHDAPRLHALRLRVKRLRYAAEFFAPLFAAKPARRFIRRLSTLQDRLGVMNDRTVAEKLLDMLGGATGPHRYAVGVVLGYSAAETTNLHPRILRIWGKIRRQPPFWA